MRPALAANTYQHQEYSASLSDITAPKGEGGDIPNIEIEPNSVVMVIFTNKIDDDFGAPRYTRRFIWVGHFKSHCDNLPIAKALLPSHCTS